MFRPVWKFAVKPALTVAASMAVYVVTKNVIRLDQDQYNKIAAKMQCIDEAVDDAFQVYRKRELLEEASGEVLHLNSGSGRIIRHLHNGITVYHANEVNPELHSVLEERLKDKGVTDYYLSTQTPLQYMGTFADHSIDTVVLDGGLQYVAQEDVVKVIEECNRVLKKGGKLLFCEPTYYPSIFSVFQSIRARFRRTLFDQVTYELQAIIPHYFRRSMLQDWSRPTLNGNYTKSVVPLTTGAPIPIDKAFQDISNNLGIPAIFYQQRLAGIAWTQPVDYDANQGNIIFGTSNRGLKDMIPKSKIAKQEEEEIRKAIAWERNNATEKQRTMLRNKRGDVTQKTEGFSQGKVLK